ncbi:MAG: sulfatase-like hydrolase/transferase [Pirellulales bacterium]|nr:sulfatase-like hydrolase/transferase [Pirellulales bacterium]
MKPHSHATRRLVFVVVTLLIGFLTPHAFAAEKPNFVVIFTDDQGYGDLGCYGSKTLRTPRIDRLAKEGTRFTDFYAQTVCGPSRTALLTGRYPIRSGDGWSVPTDEVTIAEVLKRSGYATCCIGKWDISGRKAVLDRMPRAQGFDYYFGPLGANDRGRVRFYENNEPAGSTRDMGCLTRKYTDKATRLDICGSMEQEWPGPHS